MNRTNILPVSQSIFQSAKVLEELDNLQIFDASVAIGTRMVPFDGDLSTPADILRLMDRYEIRKAVCFHHAAIENHPNLGNKLLMEQLSGQQRLLPQWVILPDSTREFPDPEDLAALLKENGVRSVRMAPRTHNYPLTPWCCGTLLETLETRAVPVFITVAEIEWNDLAMVLNAFPELKIVLTDTGYRIGRKVYPLLDQFENLFLEFSDYVIHWGLEDLCERFGPERFVYGSGLGRWDPGTPLTVLALADISTEAKRLIAGKNLCRLLGLEEQ
ncbi:MAG TPA: amidohydrolase family protein [bacterium]|nr:amidohydrolase family protein [bacterium]HQL61105.1 amidohydrolase family protein [bacterium]